MNITKKDFPVTPETKIGALLEMYPQLEPVFIEMSPAFSKLRNPVLRKTIARVASLRQVAQLGNVRLSDLINRLREAVGLDDLNVEENSVSETTNQPLIDKVKKLGYRVWSVQKHPDVFKIYFK